MALKSMTRIASFDLIANLACDPAHGWSMGTFGAVAEFVRDADEPATITREAHLLEIFTTRGGMRLAPTEALTGVAWDTLSADGETWGHALAFCAAQPVKHNTTVQALGCDSEALRPQDRQSQWFDLGVGCGAVRMCARTADPQLIAALTRAAGTPLLADPALMVEMLRSQPHRVMVSPAGRIEVYQAIPAPDGKSPEGPHTHLLAKLIGKGAHSANTPIPAPLQSLLTLHPRSPWRDALGVRHAYNPAADATFAPLLAEFGLPSDTEIQTAIEAAIASDVAPSAFTWPDSRRGRTKARITLRRIAARGDVRVAPWKALHDTTGADALDPADADA